MPNNEFPYVNIPIDAVKGAIDGYIRATAEAYVAVYAKRNIEQPVKDYLRDNGRDFVKEYLNDIIDRYILDILTADKSTSKDSILEKLKLEDMLRQSVTESFDRVMYRIGDSDMTDIETIVRKVQDTTINNKCIYTLVGPIRKPTYAQNALLSICENKEIYPTNHPSYDEKPLSKETLKSEAISWGSEIHRFVHNHLKSSSQIRKLMKEYFPTASFENPQSKDFCQIELWAKDDNRMKRVTGVFRVTTNGIVIHMRPIVLIPK